MIKQLSTLPTQWFSAALLIATLISIALPAGYGLAQAPASPLIQESPLEPPEVTPTTPAVVPISAGNILGYHTVGSEETLFCIGRAYGIDPYAIAAQNGILNPNLIFPGQRLASPSVPRTLPAGKVCPRQFDSTSPSPTCRWYHSVVSGENLYRISLHYSVSMYAIAEANHILNLNYILIGQVLCIP